MQITEENVAELEKFHGKGMIVVLSVGDSDFAFRRPNGDEVSYALVAQAEKQGDFLENLTYNCLLSADAPRAGCAARKAADGTMLPPNAELSEAELAALLAEKGRLEALWGEAQQFRDEVSLQFAWSCGSNPALDCRPVGGGRYEIKLTANSNAAQFGISLGLGDMDASIVLTAKKASRPVYDQYRKTELTGSDGEAERYIFDALIDSADRADIARLYPFAVIAIGQYLPTLGTEGRSVRVKKFGTGPAPELGNSSEAPASAVTLP